MPPSDTSDWSRVGQELPEPTGPEPTGRPGPEALDGGPFCATCRGHRWLRHDVEPGDPLFGVLRRCKDCGEGLRVQRLNRLAAAAGLASADRVKIFASFTPRRGAEAALRAAAAFAQQPRGLLVLYGRPGSGKTHLGMAICNALVLAERAVRWWYAPELVELARLQVKRDAHHELLAELRAAPVLVLDDLGAARATDYVVTELLEPLVDHRYRHPELGTAITCIGSPAEIKAEFSESIGRRLEDSAVCTAVENRAAQWKGRP